MNTIMVCLLISFTQPEQRVEPVETKTEKYLETFARVATKQRYWELRDQRIIVEGDK